MIDWGERTNNKTMMVLLDWEKAFDNVSQAGLLAALERMNVDEKLIRAISSLYRKPTYKVEVDGVTSGWYEQRAGIRQGCPLSPNL